MLTTTISQAYNGGTATTVAAYSYNEIGQLIAKNLGQVSTASIPSNLTLTSYGATTATASNNIYLNPTFSVTAGNNFNAYISTNYLQTVDMRYNIRGQLTTINNSKLSYDGGITNNDSNDLFGMQMIYDQTDANLGNTAYHDGKLSAVKWMSKDASNNSSYERSFSYSYDGINRYTGETYAERATTSTGSFNNNVDGFDENGITYDAGGNILTLNRNSSTQGTNTHIQIDNLNYAYSSTNPNQLLTVTDGIGANYTSAGFRNLTGTTTGNYTYDANGNLTADPYKGLTIAYDVLNRTDKITVTTGSGQYINYTYDANGNLIRKQAYNGGSLQTTTDYIEGFVYVNSALSYFPMPEGRVLNNAGTLKQEFIIADQQGNARISFQDNGSGVAVVKQENSYYGFGLIMPNSPVALPTTPNKQLYNGGSEWQNDYSNLPDYYQTFNRNYDAALGRFVGVDPVAEGAESLTSYQYSGNNPIMYNDPLGDLAKLVDPPAQGAASSEFDADQEEGIAEQQLLTDVADLVYGAGAAISQDVTDQYVGNGPVIGTVTVGASGTGGAAYSVNSEGLIYRYGSFVPASGNTEQDVLFAMSGSDVNRSTFITVNEGILEQLEIQSEEKSFEEPFGPGTRTVTYTLSSARFTGDEQADALFSFLAKNTYVEWGLVKFGDHQAYLSTSHSQTFEIGAGAEAIDLARSGETVTELDHSHLANSAWAGGDDNDYAQAAILMDLTRRNQIIPIVFKIFDNLSHSIIQYDSTGDSTTQKPIPWY